jgi:amino-acid N-acetyltransferase
VHDVEIAPATPRERAALEQLVASCGLPSTDLAQHLAHCLVARSGGALAGVVGLERAGRYSLLRSLAVAPAFRGRRIARALCSHAIAHAAAHGAEAVYLLTTTAEAFFSASGFCKVGRDAVPAEIRATLQFTSFCPASAVVMTKDVRAP